MNKPAIIGAVLLCSLGWLVASCSSSSKSNNAGAGGQSSMGGGSSTGGAHDAGTDGGQTVECAVGDAGIEYDLDGGLSRLGFTDPEDSVVLGVGGFYAMPNTDYHGYCFTLVDPGGSSINPPCGNTGPCFTASTGLCPVMSLGIAKTTTPAVWGGGVGCNLGQKQGTNTFNIDASIAGKASVTVAVRGCKAPTQLQVQLNVYNPPVSDAGVLGDGYFCNLATLSAPDSNGERKATIPLNKFSQDCWNPGGPVLDPATMTVTSLQVQVNAGAAKANWDFCISKMSID